MWYLAIKSAWWQVCSIVHEANARQKGEFFVKKARDVFHPVTYFIPKRFNERTLPKEEQKSFRAFFAETALIIRFDSNFKKETVRCHFKFKGIWRIWLTPINRIKVTKVAVCQTLGSLSNDNGDGNENVTNLHIHWAKTIALHALHVRFSLLSISLPSSAKQQREIAIFEVLWTTLALEHKLPFSPLN